MAVDMALVTRFHPDAIDVPGDPQRLRSGADGLQQLVDDLTDVGRRLREADAPRETRGPTVRAMSNVAGTLARVIEADADQLTEVVELARRQADRLDETREVLEDVRRRWRQARQDLRDEIGELNERAAQAERERERDRERDRDRRRDGREPDREREERREPEPPTEAAAIIRAMDQRVLTHVEGPLRRIAGLEFTDRHGAMAMAMNGPVEHAAERYHHRVQAALDDLVESLRGVERTDGQLVEQLPRREKAVASAVQQTSDAPADPTRVSRPEDITSVGDQLRECAQELNRCGDRFQEIRLALRAGRLTPDDDRQGSMNGFQRTWTRHLDEMRQDLVHAREAGDDIARQLRELDERGARDVRRAFRAQ